MVPLGFLIPPRTVHPNGGNDMTFAFMLLGRHECESHVV